MSLERRRIGHCRARILSGTSLALSIVMLGQAAPALAQEAADTAPAANAPADADKPGAPADDIVVTGSRITRDGYSQPTPVTVAPASDLQLATPTNLPDALNKLPQFQGSFGNKSNSQLFANSGEHGNILNLRNVGGNRVLVLLDGLRVPPTTYKGAVDTNVIPQLLIERVDVVTAGASAAYGSDAVSGVVNFVLDKNFTGVKGTLQQGISTRGDLSNYRVGLALGTKFADGRGHAMLSYEHFETKGLIRAERPLGGGRYSAVGRTAGGAAAGTDANPLVFVSGAASTAIDFNGRITSGPLAGTTSQPEGGYRAAVNGPPTGTAGIFIGGDGAWIQADNTLVAPLNTDQVFGRISYELTDDIEAYVQGNYATSDTYYQTQANNMGNGAAGRIYSGNPFIPDALQTQMTAQNIDSFTLTRFFTALGPLPTEEKAKSYMISAGLRGKIGGNWKWNVDYIRGWSETSVAQKQFEVAKLYAALDAVRDNGKTVCRVTITNPGLYPGCIPINVLGVTPAQDAVDYVTGVSRYRAVTTTNDITASLQGDLFELPAGPVSVAVGGEYRDQTLDLTSNADPAVPVDFTGIRGNPTTTRFISLNVGSAHGKVTVKEAFGEIAIPILRDTPFFRALDLNGAVRYTDYSTSGAVTTWKVGATWKPVDDLMIRATMSRDIRAPALFDLFAGTQFTSSTIVDTHSGRTDTVPQYISGNTNLKPEIGKTFTVGGVFTPSFLNGFSMSVDYYNLRIDGAITQLAAAALLVECENSNGTAASCAQINRPLPFSDRTTANFPTSISLIPQNLSSIKTAGFDIDASYRTRLGSGSLALRAYVNIMLYYKQQNSSTTPVIDYGGYGVNGTVNYARPKFKATLSANYETDRFRFFVQENIIGKVKIGPLQTYDVPALAPVFYTDATVAYKLPERYGKSELFLTVTNLFDKQPPLVPNAGVPDLYYPTLFSLYDIAGRTFTVGARVKF